MPHSVQKRGSKFAIVKKLPGGKTKTVGTSTSKKKAKQSASIRDRADKR